MLYVSVHVLYSGYFVNDGGGDAVAPGGGFVVAVQNQNIEFPVSVFSCTWEALPMVAKKVNIQVHISNRCIWATHVLLRFLSIIDVLLFFCYIAMMLVMQQMYY